MNDTKAHQLLEALGLNIVKEGAGRRYPCGEPGPAAGYRYWATHTEGRIKLGVQQMPKQELSSALQQRLLSNGFLLTRRTEGFVWLEPSVASSIDAARVTLRQLQDLLHHEG
ncbi:hypothetical protein [Phenylobacterium sp.]|uniref:hypothetical protein n=1 Tax=Phenylobacterium sp. TaxID=1871053 RepID=UPI0035AED48C